MKEIFDVIKNRGADAIAKYKEDMARKAMMISGNREYVIKSFLDSDVKDDQLDDEILGAINKPALILWGSDDTAIDPKYANIFKEKIKGSELYFVEGGGHSPHFTKPDDVAALLLQFINKNSQK